MRIGVMCSGNGTNFENIVRSCREDEVVVMIHNKEKCGAAKRAQKLGIPHTHIKSKREDLIIDYKCKKSAMTNSHTKDSDYFKVKKVIKKLDKR